MAGALGVGRDQPRYDYPMRSLWQASDGDALAYVHRGLCFAHSIETLSLAASNILERNGSADGGPRRVIVMASVDLEVGASRNNCWLRFNRFLLDAGNPIRCRSHRKKIAA